MKQVCLCVVLLLSVASLRAAEPRFTRQSLFDKVRIPKIVVAPDGSVLAFAESCSRLRRSEDGGRTWSDPIEIAGAKGGNALIDDNTKDVLIVTPRAGALWRSSDNGVTWRRESITILPNDAGHGAGDVRADVACSESGLTLHHGEHRGRLLMPARVQPPQGNNAQEFWQYNYNTAIFSDNSGRTWQTSGPVQSGTGEGTLAELSDGSIYYNSRSHMAIDDRRQIAMSYDGGRMWVDWRVDETLREVGEPSYYKYGTHPSYGCNAGLVRLPAEVADGQDVLIYSTPDNPGGERVRMTVWASFDRGRTWPVKRVVYEGPSAYSSLTADSRGNIFLLYECGDQKLYERIEVARFDLAWICGGRNWKKWLKAD